MIGERARLAVTKPRDVELLRDVNLLSHTRFAIGWQYIFAEILLLRGAFARLENRPDVRRV